MFKGGAPIGIPIELVVHSYAGIIRIRFEGLISARPRRTPLNLRFVNRVQKYIKFLKYPNNCIIKMKNSVFLQP